MMGVSLDRLSVRLAVGITLLVVVPLAAGLYSLSHQHFDRTIEARRRSAQLQNRILETTLRHQMVEKDTTLITAILSEIGAQPEVSNALILDHEGTIRFASQPSLVGQQIPRDSATCLVCHVKRPDERELSVLLEGEEGSELRSVQPIENRPECHECHAPENRLNGILILDVSLAEVEQQLRADSTWMTAGTALLALIVLAGMGLLVRKLILVRLSRLRRTARSIAAGELGVRAVVDDHDTISSLAADLNHMADALSRLIAEVRGREAQLTGVMNSLDDGLVVLDKEMRVVASNRSFCRRLGAHPETLRGQCCTTGGHQLPCCTEGVPCPAQRCLATGELQRAVFHAESASGEAAIVEEVYASPVYGQDGEVVQVVELWRDISERVKEEERLAEIERLVSLGVLASGFSHEVNTPLASMLICAEGALGRIAEADDGKTGAAVLPAVREYAETIRTEVLRCRGITERFLRFSRGIPPTVEPIELRQVVGSVVSLAAPTAREAGATIEIEEGDPLPAVRANTEVVQHVILNLLVNAIQSCDGETRRIAVRFVCGAEVRILIEDTGCGIPPEARKHLFEPFRSRKPHGTGLGLFLSRSFMRRFGGDVRLSRSDEGEGSCFEIIFPLAGRGRS